MSRKPLIFRSQKPGRRISRDLLAVMTQLNYARKIVKRAPTLDEIREKGCHENARPDIKDLRECLELAIREKFVVYDDKTKTYDLKRKGVERVNPSFYMPPE